MPFVVGPFAMIVVGFSIMLGLQGDFERQLGASYTAVIIACMGIYPSAPALIAWAGNNLAPASRRAVGLGLNISVGNLGGIMGSYLFFDSDAPEYSTGFGLSLAFCLSGLIAALIAEVAYRQGNKKKDAWSEEEVRALYTQDQLVAMGEKSPLFKYTL